MANPTSFQQMLNNMLPPKVVNGVTYVPRVSTTNGGEAGAQVFSAPRDGRYHGGIDTMYGRLDTAQAGSPAVVNIGSWHDVNQNVLIGSPVDGKLRIVTENPKLPGNKIAVIEGTNGVEYVIRHMSHLPIGLDGQTIKAGTVVGTMSNVGTGPVHGHMSAYTTVMVDGKTQRVAIDPYTFYKNNFDLSKTDMIVLVDQNGIGYSTIGGYRPSELVKDEQRKPVIGSEYKYENASLTPVRIGGMDALRDYLVGLEGGGDYRAVNEHGALGAYQMMPDALREAKYLDANGKWTGKDGVWSNAEFLSNKTAQDNAFALNVEAVKRQLRSNGAWAHLGESLPDGTVLTEGSLIGAGWFGAGNVAKYFDGGSNRTDANGASVAYRLRSFSRFDPSVPADTPGTPAAPVSDTPTGGYWHYPTYPDEMGNLVSVPGERVWISDSTSIASNGDITGSATGIAAVPKATSTPAVPLPEITTVLGVAEEPLTFKLGNGKLIRAGDDLDSADGRLVAFDKANNALVIDVKVGENLYERRTYSASGKVTIQAWEFANDQLDASTGEAIQYFNGDVYSIAGDKYVFVTGRGLVHQGTGELAAASGEISQFVLTRTSVADSYDPTNSHSKDAINGMDLDSDQYPTRQGNARPPATTTPMSYRTVEVDGQTYELTANGTLDRKLPGQPGWTESRDSTGGGVITDAEGNVMAELQPGDRVGMMDDGRITVNDIAGRSVNRTIDESAASAFAAAGMAPSQPPPLESDEDAWHPSDAVNGADLQSDQYLSTIDLPLSRLASLHLYRAFCLCVVALCCTSVFAGDKTSDTRPDPKELIGKEVEGHNYPDGWRASNNPFYDANHSLDGQIIYKKNTRAFVLRKILAKRTDSSPRRTVVIDAVQIRINPAKYDGLFISECKHPGVQEKPNQRIFAEVRFKRCERYSSRVSAAWLIDTATQKISPVSPKGMRCVDTFFNNGPDGPKCPPIPAEW